MCVCTYFFVCTSASVCVCVCADLQGTTCALTMTARPIRAISALQCRSAGLRICTHPSYSKTYVCSDIVFHFVLQTRSTDGIQTLLFFFFFKVGGSGSTRGGL